MSVKKENKLVGVVADPIDQRALDFLSVKLGLKYTQIYRLALRRLEREERKVD